MRRGSVILRHQACDLGAAIAELGACTARLDNGHADPETGDFLGDRFNEAFDAPLGGVIQRVTGECHLTAIRRQLNDPAVALSAHDRQYRTDQLDRAEQVGGDHGVDLTVRQLFGRTKQAIAGVTDHHIEMA